MKRIVIFVMLIAVLLAGCSIINTRNHSDNSKILQALELAYKPGNYSMKSATCSGFITSSQTGVFLSVPLEKVILEGQAVSVTAIPSASLRVDGTYVGGYQKDLTGYIESAYSRNNGSVLFITLNNPDKWTDANGKTIGNNLPIAGVIDIQYTVTGP